MLNPSVFLRYVYLLCVHVVVIEEEESVVGRYESGYKRGGDETTSSTR